MTNEYENLREELIKFGIISFEPKKNVKTYSKDFIKKLRKDLVNRGFITPIERENGELAFCEPPTHVKHNTTDSGEYKVKKIYSNEEYERRKQSYFRILQEVLYYRKKLNLVLGKKNDLDPDWYF